MSRLSKDQDTLDTELSTTLFQVGDTAVSIFQSLNSLSIASLDFQLCCRNRKVLCLMLIY